MVTEQLQRDLDLDLVQEVTVARQRKTLWVTRMTKKPWEEPDLEAVMLDNENINHYTSTSADCFERKYFRYSWGTIQVQVNILQTSTTGSSMLLKTPQMKWLGHFANQNEIVFNTRHIFQAFISHKALINRCKCVSCSNSSHPGSIRLKMLRDCIRNALCIQIPPTKRSRRKLSLTHGLIKSARLGFTSVCG